MALKEPVGESVVPPAGRQGPFPLDKVTFGVAAGLAVAFLLWGTIDSTGMGETTATILGELTSLFGWLFILVSAVFLLFSAYLAITRYGNIRLGPDDSKPEFSTFSWVSMMFATGMGIGLMFWGVAEPLTHLNTPPLGRAEPGSGRGTAVHPAATRTTTARPRRYRRCDGVMTVPHLTGRRGRHAGHRPGREQLHGLHALCS